MNLQRCVLCSTHEYWVAVNEYHNHNVFLEIKNLENLFNKNMATQCKAYGKSLKDCQIIKGTLWTKETKLKAKNK